MLWEREVRDSAAEGLGGGEAGHREEAGGVIRRRDGGGRGVMWQMSRLIRIG